MRIRGQQAFIPRSEVPRLQPHQASPEQFRRLPGILWHGNYSQSGPDRDPNTEIEFNSRRHDNYQSAGVHAGSRRAAMDALDMWGPYSHGYALGRTGRPDSDMEERAARERGGRHGFLHPVLPDPSRIAKGNNFDEGEDWTPAVARVNQRLVRETEDAGEWNLRESDVQRGLRYTNTSEHPGTTSTLIPTGSPMTHEDYVRQAIRDGRAHEVHPLTMDLFKRGLLTQSQASKYDPIPYAGSRLGSETKRSSRTARVRATRKREELKGQRLLEEQPEERQTPKGA